MGPSFGTGPVARNTNSRFHGLHRSATTQRQGLLWVWNLSLAIVTQRSAQGRKLKRPGLRHMVYCGPNRPRLKESALSCHAVIGHKECLILSIKRPQEPGPILHSFLSNLPPGLWKSCFRATWHRNGTADPNRAWHRQLAVAGGLL